MHRLTTVLAGALALAVAFALFGSLRARSESTPACGQTSYANEGVLYRVLFAKNGAVQQYVLVTSSHNLEQDHDVLKEAEAIYGPEGVNAPPLQIVAFRQGPGGMMIPDKAKDSCGRITAFK
jgi:hypothetical protein